MCAAAVSTRCASECRTASCARTSGRPVCTRRLGPPLPPPPGGPALVGARPPLVAFNVELAPPATLDDAREIAARIREGGSEGVPSLRAIGVWLAHRHVAQVSTNVEDHRATRLADVVAAIAPHARPARAELVGL